MHCGQGNEKAWYARSSGGRRSRRRLKPFQPLVHTGQLEPERAFRPVEGRGARPRATDEPLVGGGQGCALPSRKESIRGGVCGAGREARGSVGASGMHGKGPTEGSRGARARAERTWNMYFMVVTLDVSKLSGWLNADAPPHATCRVARRANDVGARCGPGGGGATVGWRRRKWHVRERLDSRLGPRARIERTSNMLRMFLTLEVSKGSGWLNASTCCRGERRAYDAGRDAGREGVGVAAAQAACSSKVRLKVGG